MSAPSRGPNNSSPPQLKKWGLTIASLTPFTLRCDRCGKTWTPPETARRLKGGYWRCPDGCNAPA